MLVSRPFKRQNTGTVLVYGFWTEAVPNSCSQIEFVKCLFNAQLLVSRKVFEVHTS